MLKRAIIVTALICSISAFALGSRKSQKAPVGAESPDRVWVVRPDGAKQCDATGAETVEHAEEALAQAKIRVFDSVKGNDGAMHAAMCGVPAGTLNGYLIQKSDLPAAAALGFKEAPPAFGKR